MTIVAERAEVARGVRMAQCVIQMRPRSTRPSLLLHDRRGLSPLPSFPRTRKGRLRSDRGNQGKTPRFKAKYSDAKKTPREGERRNRRIHEKLSGARLKR